MRPKSAAAAALRPLAASEVLDVPPTAWSERSWESRRDPGSGGEPVAFCDRAASEALAKLAGLGGAQPSAQRFLSHGQVDAWLGEFAWGRAWCASRGAYFWAWAQGDGATDGRVEISGKSAEWDADLACAFAESLAAGEVDKPYY